MHTHTNNTSRGLVTKAQQSHPHLVKPELLGLSVISAPIRLAVRNHGHSEHWSSSETVLANQLSNQHVKGGADYNNVLQAHPALYQKVKNLGILAAQQAKS